MKIKQNGAYGDVFKKRDDLQKQLAFIRQKYPQLIADGKASVAIKAVADLVADSLDKNRLVHLETMIRFLDETVFFKENDMRKLQKLAYSSMPPSGGEIRNRSDIDAMSNFGRSATLFIAHFYSWKLAVGESPSWPLVKIIDKEADFALDWIAGNAKAPSKQMLEEFACEWRRTIIFARLIEFLIIVTNRGTVLPSSDWQEIIEVGQIMHGQEAFIVEVERKVKGVIDDLSKKYKTKSGLGISDKERLEILKATGLTQGHWFKCPNGK